MKIVVHVVHDVFLTENEKSPFNSPKRKSFSLKFVKSWLSKYLNYKTIGFMERDNQVYLISWDLENPTFKFQ